MPELLEYSAAQVRNRETFLLNYPKDFRACDWMIGGLQAIWSRISRERDRQGRFHTGLLGLVNLLVRHSIFGFQHITTYQSALAWFTFRPGLEALLMLGKWVDDPTNARVWRNRLIDRDAYRQTFSGQGLVSASLPRSAEFRRVLSRLNDEFMHPNPEFTYRDTRVVDEGRTVVIALDYFDRNIDIHEAHVLAYLNLLDEIVWSSLALVNSILGPDPTFGARRQHYSEVEGARAGALAGRNQPSRRILEELGLWVLPTTGAGTVAGREVAEQGTVTRHTGAETAGVRPEGQ
jgi:hypothetical protein